MIALETDGWTGAELLVHIFGNEQTWAYDARIGASAADVYTVLADIAAWIVPTFIAEGITACTVGHSIGDEGRVAFTLTVVGEDFEEYNANATLAAKLGWSSALESPLRPTIPHTGETNTGAIGTAAADAWQVSNWTRWGRGGGSHSSAAGWSHGVASSELRRPVCRGLFSESGMLALDAAQKAASSPRRASVRHDAYDTWRFVTMGQIGPPDPLGDGATLYKVGMAVIG